jgi:hypothetical protein
MIFIIVDFISHALMGDEFTVTDKPMNIDVLSKGLSHATLNQADRKR